MIRPYLAVIKDSFRAALANRVLYLLLGMTTLLLAALFPTSLEEKLTSRVRDTDIVDFMTLARTLAAAKDDGEATAPGRVWTRLPEDLQKRLTEIAADDQSVGDGDGSFEQLKERSIALGGVLSALNDMLDDRELYSEEAWSDYSLNEEARELKEKGLDKLSDEEAARFNRLLITTTFAREISPGAPTSLVLSYAVWELPMGPIPIRKDQLPQLLDIPWMLDKFVLSVGVFIAILVTASVIPQMLEPGSLNLLLSKPINRSLLLISKYVGACAFTLIFSAYLFIGLWLFFGMRLGIWESAFLYCVPLYVLVFAIYFSVSALAGVVFRNTIMAVVSSILFWLLCFVVGLLYTFIHGIVTTYEVREVVVNEDGGVLKIDRKNVPYGWDSDKGKWGKDALVAEFNEEYAVISHFVASDELQLPRLLGPVYDSKKERFYLGQTPQMTAASGMGSDREFGMIVKEEGEWKYKKAFGMPDLSIALFQELDGSVIAVTRLGSVYRLEGDPVDLLDEFEAKLEAAGETEEGDENAAGDGPDESSTPTEESDDAEMVDLDFFNEVGPSPPLDYSNPAQITMNPETGELLCISRGSIEIITKGPDGRYMRPEKYALTLPGSDDLSSQVWFAGETIIVARGNGQIYRVHRPTMEVIDSFEPESTAAIEQLVGSKDGRWFAALYSNGKVWLGDNQSDNSQMARADVRKQGDLSAIAFDSQNRLWVADRNDHLRGYDPESSKMVAEQSPRLGLSGNLYRYVLIPVYTVCPKPGEFYRLVTHLTAEDELAEDVERRVSQRRDPWEPLWNGVIFVAAMLGIACIYFEMQDF